MFDTYKAISLQIREIFAEYTPIIEPLLLDEAYLDVMENRKRIPSATQIAEEIRASIRAETRLTAAAGVSYSKFLAKLASDHREPDGLFVISPDLMRRTHPCRYEMILRRPPAPDAKPYVRSSASIW